MKRIDTEKRNSMQVEEALGPDNKYFAGEKLGHEPSKSEALMHYVLNGGADSFRERHPDEEFLIDVPEDAGTGSA